MCQSVVRMFAVGVLISFGTTGARAAIVDGLTAYWRFDETSGTTAADSAGTYPAVLRTNASFVNDAQRGSVMSTGTGNALYDDDAGIPFLSTSAGTLLAWINLNEVSGTQFIFEEVDYSVGSEPRLYVYVSNGAYKVGIGTTSGYSTSIGSVSPNAWHQVALTWNEGTPGSGSGDVTAFFDGQAVFGTTYSGLTSLGHYLAIGSSFFPSAGGGVVGNSLRGMMDEAAVWNRELGQQEVQDIYNQGYVLAPVPEPGSLMLLALGASAIFATRAQWGRKSV